MEVKINPDIIDADKFQSLAERLVEVASIFYSRGWLYGTSGNLSAVVTENPLTMAITGSGINKGRITPSEIIKINGDGHIIKGNLKKSSETPLHLAVVRELHAGSVLHTHSVWSAVLSRRYLGAGGLSLNGYEMLKGLEGVGTHQYSEWIPILENSQDMDSLSVSVSEILNKNPGIHGFMLAGHGLYSWGKTVEDAERHIEVIEYLLEVIGRSSAGTDNILKNND